VSGCRGMRSKLLSGGLCAICLVLGVTASYSAFLVCRSETGQGEANPSCFQEPLHSVPGPGKWSITGHYVYCDNIVHWIGAYVYLSDRSLRTPPRRTFLEYSPDEGALDPQIEWRDATHAAISLGHVLQIWKIESGQNDVAISYSILGETLPRPGWWITGGPMWLGVPMLSALALASFFGALRSIRNLANAPRIDDYGGV
jgi:hypothetical protein